MDSVLDLFDAPITVSAALRWAADQLRASSPSARLDADLLLASILGWSRAHLLAEQRMLLDATQVAAFQALVERRLDLEPVAYLIGRREFYGLEFFVNRAVLIPRPETELLVDFALAWARNKPAECRIADICTGSGCIAIALAVHLPAAQISATDLSPEALVVAAQNVAAHDVAGRVMLRQGDLLEAIEQPVDLLISNPPYTILNRIDEGVRRHEPALALDGGPDGLMIYRRLLEQAPAALRPGGALFLEIGAYQGPEVVALAEQFFPGARLSLYQDLAGLDRVVAIETAV